MCIRDRDYKTVIQDAVLIVNEGQVVESGKVAIPKNAVVIDGKGAFVYPSFIDLYSNAVSYTHLDVYKRQAFDDFNYKKIEKYDSGKVEELMQNAGIIRNRLKILATINNCLLYTSRCV